MKALMDELELASGTEDLALARALDPARLPAHVAIIMDGNDAGGSAAFCHEWPA